MKLGFMDYIVYDLYEGLLLVVVLELLCFVERFLARQRKEQSRRQLVLEI